MTLLQDIRCSLRSFAKSPGFIVICILTLAIGIGLNGAIFSFMNMLLFRKLPLNLIKEPEKLVFLWSENKELGLDKRPASVGALADWRKVRSLGLIAGGHSVSLTLAGAQAPIRLNGFRTTPEFFALLGVLPALGRGFLADENLPGADRVVVLSHRAWEQHFGGDPQIVSRSIRLDGSEHRVVGVMPDGFYMPSPSVDVFLPLGIAPGQRDRGDRFLMTVARLAEGVSTHQAQAEMDIVSQRLAVSYPDSESGWRVQVKPLLEEMYDGGLRLSAVILMVAVGIVLLLACANLCGLILARSAVRTREIALRCSLGASRARLVRQLLTESILLALFGGAAGVLLAVAVTGLLGRTTGGFLRIVGDVGVDSTTLVFMVAASLVSAMIFGLIPALQASRPNLTDGLKEGSNKASLGLKGRRMLDSIVVIEVALSLMLLVLAGLMMRTISAWREVSPGYDTSRLLTFRLSLPDTRYGDPQQVRAFVARMEERLSGLPGVKGVAAGTSFPADQGKAVREFLLEGGTVGVKGAHPWGQVVTVSPGYLETLGIPLLAGRYVTSQDAEGAPLAALISKSLKERYWPGKDPVGQRFRFASESDWIRVAGVVGDLEHYNVHNGPMPLIFVPLAQRPERALSVALRTTSAASMGLAPAVQKALAEIDPAQPLYDVQEMDAVISDNFAGLRLISIMLGFFGLVALLLASLGIYGIISYAVGRRSHEIGVRMALGAMRSNVLMMILLQAGKLALIGIAVGVLGALGLTRLMSSLLFGVGAIDPVTFGTMAAVLLGVALLASFLPGRRAARVDPVITLRSQ